MPTPTKPPVDENPVPPADEKPIPPAPPIEVPDNTEQALSLASGAPVGQWQDAGPDVWSAAYHIAMESLNENDRRQIMRHECFGELLKKLDEIDGAHKTKSFQRGLDRLQGPLATCKLVLDFTAPFLGVEPTAATAVGVVQGVTTVAIGICGAASELSGHIKQMLECVPYIDRCDTLNNKGDVDESLQQALVTVYKDLLSFYLAALELLDSKYYLMKVTAAHLQDRIPTIVNQFVRDAEWLDKHIDAKVLQLLQGIKQLNIDAKVRELLPDNASKDHTSFQKRRSGEACSWLSKDTKFTSWYSVRASKNLLLYGSKGCGKTITASYIIDEVIARNKAQLPKPLTCYYYCTSDSSIDSVKIMSSLVLQLLHQKGGVAKKKFCDWYDDTKKNSVLDPTQSFPHLSSYFMEIVDKRPVYIILDGLDECSRETLDDLIPFILGFSEKKILAKFFLSSRHTHSRIGDLQKHSISIAMIQNTERDTAIVHHLVKKSLSNVQEDMRSEIIKQLSARAGGSALWIKISVDLLQEYLQNEIDTMEELVDYLNREICQLELSELYGKLFSRITKESTVKLKPLLPTVLEILAVAKRPLLAQELRWAIALSQPVTKRVLSDIHNSAEDLPVKRALEVLQPFLHITEDEKDPNKSYVRLAHASVRELVLQSSPASWEHLSNIEENPARRSELEATLSKLCVEYLMLDELDQKDLFNAEQREIQILWDALPVGYIDSDDGALDHAEPDDTDSMYYDPVAQGFGGFFAYSSCFWIEHLRNAPVESFPTIETITALTSAKSRRLSNWYKQSHRPNCTLRSKSDDDISRLDPLIFASLYGPTNMLQQLLAEPMTENCFANDSVEIAVEEIIQRGDVSRLKYFLQYSHQDNVRSLVCYHLMRQWTERKSSTSQDDEKWDECFNLFLPSSEEMIKQKSGNEWLCRAVKYSCLPLVKKLFEAADSSAALRRELLCSRSRNDTPGQHPSPYQHQSVGIAVRNQDLEMLRYLLSQQGIEAHLNHVDSGGYGVLHRAAQMACLEVFKLLVPLLKAHVNRTNSGGDTALHLLAFGSVTAADVECAKVLLVEGKADVYGHSEGRLEDDWHLPLRLAVRSGSIEMCRLLIEEGHADPRVALKVNDEGASLLDYVDHLQKSHKEKLEKDILAMLTSFSYVES
ncbi:hypothetical protein F4777DRAFT_381795 [Nemania sp. FL0916]|nr:hypothetical protein F4777DRAFT_381795 [Nemania sp. FL0916]